MRTCWGIALVSALLGLSGCSVAPVLTTTSTNSLSGATITGRVHGGQNPISGASVDLYAVGTGAYAGPGIAASTGNASVSLLTNPVTTDENGNFSISGDYTCGVNQQVYIYASGGNPGLASGTNNTAVGLLAGLGSCSTLASNKPFILVNEVSTIATAYALAGFATDATHISSSGSTLAQTNVANAMTAITNLETLSTGVTLTFTPAGNGTVPKSEINSLANILAACINTSGSTTLGTPCSTLFANALSGGTSGTQPSDTATAAINLAHNPGANVAALYALQTASAPFQPTLIATPNDFTIVLDFTGGGLAEPSGIAIDASGNAWVSNLAGGSISKFSSTGAALSPFAGFTGGGLDNPRSVAIDRAGNVWVTSLSDLNFSEFSSAGTALSPSTGFTGGGLSYPLAVAIDGFGNVWIADEYTAPYRVSEFSSTGTALSPSTGYTGGGLDVSYSIAIDGSGNAWISNGANNSISKFSSMGTALSPSTGYTGGGLFDPGAITIDSSGNVWAANYSNSSVTKLSNAGSPLSPSTGYTGGGGVGGGGIAIDGSGNIWVISSSGGVSEFSNVGTALSPPTGYASGDLGSPFFMAIDGSGDVWVVNFDGSVFEFIGVGTPVITPICAGLPAIPTANGTSNLGTRP